MTVWLLIFAGLLGAAFLLGPRGGSANVNPPPSRPRPPAPPAPKA